MINDIKVFAADIDGTLTEKGGRLGPRTRDALIKLHDEGVLMGIASGRPLDHRTIDKSKDWNLPFEFDFCIGMNGGDLWEKGNDTISHFYRLAPETIKEILTMMAPLDLNAIIYEDGYDKILCLKMDLFMQYSMERNQSHVEVKDINRLSKYPTGKVEIHFDPSREEEVWNLVHSHPSDKWQAIKTFMGTIEFIDPHLGKGVALKEFVSHRSIPLENVIAFGDEQNDIDLLQKAGWGVCLKNGCEDCKNIAQDITEYTVEEDGVGRYMEDHWFSQK